MGRIQLTYHELILLGVVGNLGDGNRSSNILSIRSGSYNTIDMSHKFYERREKNAGRGRYYVPEYSRVNLIS